jgi:hypothetical protein
MQRFPNKYAGEAAIFKRAIAQSNLFLKEARKYSKADAA